MHLLNLSKTLGELGQQIKICRKKKYLFLRWFYTLYEKKFSNLRPLLSITFAKGFKISEKFGHWTLWSGGKKILNGVNKWKKSVFDGFFFICSLCLNVFLPPLPKVQCPNFLDIWNYWAKVIKRSGLRFENFCS